METGNHLTTPDGISRASEALDIGQWFEVAIAQGRLPLDHECHEDILSFQRIFRQQLDEVVHSEGRLAVDRKLKASLARIVRKFGTNYPCLRELQLICDKGALFGQRPPGRQL